MKNKYRVFREVTSPNSCMYHYLIDGILAYSLEIFFGKPMYGSPNNYNL